MALAGRTIDLKANFFDGTAIHGQVMVSPWRHEGGGRFRIEGGGEGTGWPWPYSVEERVSVDGARLTVQLRLTNTSDAPMPGGIGLHPWFLKPVRVAIDASGVLSTNVESPAQPEPVSGDLDRRRLAVMPDRLDATWTDLADPPVVFEWLGAGVRATMTVEVPALFIVAASPGDKDAVAVEPQTHAPDGIRRLLKGEPGALSLISPGVTLPLTMWLSFERTPGGEDANAGQT
jgi:aldose 1-epimerase